MEQPDTLAALTAKLDEMHREVRRHFAPPGPKLPRATETEDADSGFLDSVLSFLFGNRK